MLAWQICLLCTTPVSAGEEEKSQEANSLSGQISGQTVQKNASEAADSSLDLGWKKPLESGPDLIFYFAEAISGKKLKPETYDLLRGVERVQILSDRIVFERVDKEHLDLSFESEHGAKFYDDWKKTKTNTEHKFGKAGLDFLESVESVQINGDRIEVLRKNNEEIQIEMGSKKLHRAFDLRAIRFRQISLAVDSSSQHPAIKDIQGVTAVLNMPGFSLPVDVKEFKKLRLEKENDLTVGVKNPVPGAMRAFLFLPEILRFHFRLARKEQ